MSRWLFILALVVILALVQSDFAPTTTLSISQGACCYPDDSCADPLDSADCESQGGVYQGDGTNCAGVECVSQPVGACCFSDGSCADDLTQAECEVQGGAYMGDGLSCAVVYCGNDVKEETESRERPSEFTLLQNYPNPFNQTTQIEFTLARPGLVTLNVFDLLGRKVRTLASRHLSSGYKSMIWDGKNDSGKDVVSGTYFYRIEVEGPATGGIRDFSETKKLVLLK